MSQSVGSLAQSARSKTLRGAKVTLLLIGILATCVGAVQWTMGQEVLREAFAAEVAKIENQGMVVDQEEVARLEAEQTGTLRLIAGGLIAIGVTFIVLGLLVYRVPVVATVTGLVLYVGLQAISAAVEPETIARGLLFKILIIACLAKAVQAAVVYQRESPAH